MIEKVITVFYASVAIGIPLIVLLDVILDACR